MNSQANPWGSPPWKIDFRPPRRPLPAHVEFAVIGAGFTGLAAAAWLRRLAPEKSVAVLEAARIGAGASGRTGGMSLAETAAGPQRGLGDVLSGLKNILKRLRVQCDLRLGGAWEIARGPGDKGLKRSPIHWNDSGTLRVVNEVPGGTLDPGKLVSGLARAAHRLGAGIYENHRVLDVHCERQAGDSRRRWPRKHSQAHCRENHLRATNALSLGVSGLQEDMHPRLTLAVLAKPVSEKILKEIGLAEKKPFYTVDFPYLWGRVRPDRSIVWGAGLVQSPDEDDLDRVDIAAPEPAQIFARLEERVTHLHPALEKTKFTHRWGGQILFRDNWKAGLRLASAKPRT